MTSHPPFRIVLHLAAAFCLAGCCGPAWAQETRSPEADARDLAAEVMRKAGDGDLGEWTRSILDRALERAGETARQTVPGSTGTAAAPLPAERHAGRFAEDAGVRAGTAEVLIFTSLSVPAASWRQWAREAARAGAAEHAGPPLVLRGVGNGGIAGNREGNRRTPRAARRPASPSTRACSACSASSGCPPWSSCPGGVPPCASRGCADDPAPPHDRVTGNIGLIAALETIADEGAVGRDAARRYLERLGREP